MADEPGYEEFEIEIRSVAGGFESRVLSSSFNRSKEPFVPPFTGDRLQNILRGLEERIRFDAGARDGSSRDLSPRRSQRGGATADPATIGRALFSALFTGSIRDRYREAVARQQSLPQGERKMGLRLRLTFDRAEDFSVLATQPWETLREDPQFLTLDLASPIVRSHNHRTVPREQAARPIRVLLVGSSPLGLPPIDVRGEAARLRRTLKKHPDVEVETFPRPDIRMLRPHLRDHPCHVLHFMGHGDFFPGAEEAAALYFEAPDRTAEPVTGAELAEVLKDVEDLRLVVLNACWGGAIPRRSGQDPFTGVAAALMDRDIPAVLAMQFPVSDRAAKAFSEVFYSRLAKGDPVSAALTEGRIAIFTQLKLTVEWATPVLFLAGDDRLFEPPSRDAAAAKKPRRPSSTAGLRGGSASESSGAPRPLLLAVRSFAGGFAATAEEPDDRLDLTEFFHGRHIIEHRLWSDEVFPRLRKFLLRHAAARRPITLDFAAHSTLAFAAGYCLEAKSGLDITLLQRKGGGTEPWHAEPGPSRPGPLWLAGKDRPRYATSDDVALPVSVTWPIADDVETYLTQERVPVRRLAPMTIHPDARPGSVENGLHALQLAQALAVAIRRRSVAERAAVLHLFTAAPNALLFFLGQLRAGLNTVQLYEHDPDARKPGAYEPSLRLPFESQAPGDGREV